MYYSSFGILAVILHLIINNEVLRNGRKEPANSPHFRYWLFLNTLMFFYIADLVWGFAVDSGIRLLAYADTVLFFGTMALSVLLWTRYVAAFLDRNGTRARVFLAAGWLIFGSVVLCLLINFFYPIIFDFTDDVTYLPHYGRYILLAVQLLLFIATAVYSFFSTLRAEGRDRIHYAAVCASGAVMAVFIVVQNFFPFAPFYTIGCLIANCLLHVFVEEDEKREQDRITAVARKNSERYSQIAASLAAEYEAIYYINIETGKYFEVSASASYEAMNVPAMGEDFYRETRENVIRYVHPDDRAFAESMYCRETMQKNLEGRKSYSYKYRVMVCGEPRYFRFVVMLSEDGEHFVVCDKDIQDTITAETALIEKQKIGVTFSQIAESLASNYDVIYYVDADTGEYVGYTTHDIYGELRVDESGSDFFEKTKDNITFLIHPGDRERMLNVMNRDHLLSALEERKQVDVQYRLVISDWVQFTRMIARKSSDGGHLIIAVENIDEEVKKENDHLRALNTEKELARRDELTGIRNKTAFSELEQSIQDNIDKGMDYLPFAFVVCDLNDLKKVNDTEGHKAGDEYIRDSAKLLCEVFDHSPVFRIGGDEFAVFIRGDDYSAREKLMKRLHGEVMDNLEHDGGPVIAAGITEYDPKTDTDVNEIFDRADRLMYEDKRRLKETMGH
ncbi:MAG: diguanylate cyclase [Lachnospiraceae bacterium]|nr:diguanylate cyclase [Lachnospiraceae bacterium]